MKDIIVFKNRTTILPVNLGFDVSDDTITSQIRVGKDSESELIAEWDVSFVTDGTDGKVLLTLDNSISATITQKAGYTDMKRVSGGEPFPVYDSSIRVSFREVVTV